MWCCCRWDPKLAGTFNISLKTCLQRQLLQEMLNLSLTLSTKALLRNCILSTLVFWGKALKSNPQREKSQQEEVSSQEVAQCVTAEHCRQHSCFTQWQQTVCGSALYWKQHSVRTCWLYKRTGILMTQTECTNSTKYPPDVWYFISKKGKKKGKEKKTERKKRKARPSCWTQSISR